MPKKRVNVRHKAGSNDAVNHTETSGLERNVLVTSSKIKSNQVSKDNDDGKTHSSSLIRIAFMIALLLGLVGILFFPKLVSLAETTMGVKSASPSKGQGHLRDNEEVVLKNVAQKDIISSIQGNGDASREEDLMENEETRRNEENILESKQKQDSLHGDKKKADKGFKKMEDTTNSDKDKSIKNVQKNNPKSSVDQSDPTNKIPPRKGRGGSGKPIILNSETNQIVLDPSQIKIPDSPPETKEGIKESGKKVTTNKPSHTKSRKDKISDRESKNNNTNVNIEDEIKNFQPTFHKTFTPKKIFDGGRRIPPVELLHQKPSNSSVKIFLFDDFLSTQECDGLMRAHDNHVKAANQTPILCFDSVDTLKRHISDAKKNIKVTPNVFTPGTRCLNESFSLQLGSWLKSNWSYSTAFYPGESTFSKIAADRIQKAMGMDPIGGGKFQITSYPVGKAYKEHTDCVLDGVDQRDRVVTVLMYLNDVEEGGETKFPELGIWVKPKKGRALVWNNMSPDGVCEPHSKHVASVVKKGSKYILIRWYYYKTFYSLGRRPVQPSLPPRDSDQAMVMCDVYNSGSCRWYDEWSYEHLLDYEKNKLTLI